MTSPIIVGGNGHSGTRLFAEILMATGVYMGVSGLSYDRKSKDLNIRGLMSRWMKPYLLGQSELENARMKRQFRRRIRMLVPFRTGAWGFKNPRSMFLLELYLDLFPQMRFIHVIRDGRDMCFGNPFINSPTYWGIISEEEANELPAAERMMRFWGESNRRVKEFGESVLGPRYLRIRFEDICDSPKTEVCKIVKFAGGPSEQVDDLSSLVRKPGSIGRWRTYDEDEVDRVVTIGREYLDEFGYV